MSDEYYPRLRVPGNMQIVRPSLRGKTTWLYRLVRDAPVYFRRADGSPCFLKKNRVLLRFPLATYFS